MAKYRFGDICEVLNGRAYKQNELLSSGKYPILRVGNFFSSDRWYYSDMELPENKYCDYEDLLFAWSASFGPKIWDGGKVIYHYHIWKLIPNDDVADKFYLYYWLRHSVNRLTAGTHGSVMAHMTKGDMENQSIELPSLQTQKKISSILRTIDEKIHNNEAINNNLEQQAMALFKSWFIDYEPFDGQVPSTWKYGVLGDFVEIKRGGSPRPIQNFLSDSGLHWLKISDATGISSPFISEIKEYIIEEGLKKTVFLKAGSLVLSNSATPGLPKILDIDTCIHDGWLYFPSSKFSNEYLYLYFKHIRDNLVALGNGSVFTNLKTDILKNYPTNLPTDEVLNEFDKIMKPIFSMILSTTRESKRLTEIRDTLLPRLMSGELDVSDIDL